MQALILTGDAGLASSLADVATEAGFHCIRYSDPLRAMDNLLDLSPDMLLVDATRFPLHFQLAQGMMASLPTSRRFPVLGIYDRAYGKKPQRQEVGSLSAYGGCGQDGDREDFFFEFDGRDVSREALFRCLSSVSSEDFREGGTSLRFMRGSSDAPGLVILHPRRLIPMSFSVRRISASGLRAVADNADLARELVTGDILPECAMTLGGRILTFGSILESSRAAIALIYDTMTSEDRGEILSYIEKSLRNNPFHQLMKP